MKIQIEAQYPGEGLMKFQLTHKFNLTPSFMTSALLMQPPIPKSFRQAFASSK